MELGLRIGDTLQLQTLQEDHPARYHVTLIGGAERRSLLVTAPQADGKIILVREGQVFVVRAFLGDRALGFRCTVLKRVAVPYPYLHLSYPYVLEQVRVRRSARVLVQLPGEMISPGPLAGVAKGTVIDLSVTGAMFECSASPGDVGARLRLNCNLPIAGMAVHLLETDVVIRNIETENAPEGTAHYGVHFMDVNPAAALALRAFVYERLAGMGREGPSEGAAP
ncbi:MAG: flagellar brake protein [Gammaproteobacteria bacterium]|nr:flagellar brake protein [Gammaproteobacteria bacterium]